MFDLARKFQSRRLDFPTKNRAAVGVHSRSKFSIPLEISNFFDLWALWDPLPFGKITGLSPTFMVYEPRPQLEAEKAHKKKSHIGVSEMASAKMASAIGVRIDNVGVDAEIPYRLPFWREFLAWLPLQSLAVKKSFFFANFGRWKTFKINSKVPVKYS